MPNENFDYETARTYIGQIRDLANDLFAGYPENHSELFGLSQVEQIEGFLTRIKALYASVPAPSVAS